VVRDREASPLGHQLLQLFDRRIFELDDVPALDTDQVIVVLVGEQSRQPQPVLGPLPADSSGLPSHNVRFRDDNIIYHGPLFRAIKSARGQGPGGVGELLAPEVAELAAPRSGEGWVLSPSLLDGCLYVCGVHLYFADNKAIGIPQDFAEIQLGRRAKTGEKCQVHWLCTLIEKDIADYDFDLYGENGDVLLTVKGYRSMIVHRDA